MRALRGVECIVVMKGFEGLGGCVLKLFAVIIRF